MGVEIERKFLVRNSWQPSGKGSRFMQGYLCADEGRTIRVRIADEHAWLTIKGPTRGSARSEFEYEIPRADAEEMLLTLCVTPPVIKTRYTEQVGTHTWEIDVFDGENAGLIVAEIELIAEGETFELPLWAGEEVTSDARYQNSSLAKKPYRSW